MDQKTALRLLRKRFDRKKSMKAHAAFVRLYMDGEVKWKVYQDECNIFYRTAKRWYDYLEAERERLESANFAPQLIAEADRKPAKRQNPSTPDDEQGKRLISGSEYVSMCEEGMLEANKDKRTRDFKIFSDLRNSVVDVAAELPTTHLDIERTVGREGLLGMDEVLAETISHLTDHIESFPKLLAAITTLVSKHSEPIQPVLENDSQDAD